MRVRQNGILEKVLFDSFKKTRMNDLPISGTILRKTEGFHASNGSLKDGKLDSIFLSNLLLEEEKQ